MFDNLKKELSKLNKVVIEVGYFDGNELNLLPSIAFWNEFGTYNIPPRPFFRNTIIKNKNKWAKNWNKKAEEQALIISEDLRCTINIGNFEKNAPITLYGGWMRNKKSKKPFYVKGKGNKTPLTDTGKLSDYIEKRLSRSQQ